MASVIVRSNARSLIAGGTVIVKESDGKTAFHVEDLTFFLDVIDGEGNPQAVEQPLSSTSAIWTITGDTSNELNTYGFVAEDCGTIDNRQVDASITVKSTGDAKKLRIIHYSFYIGDDVRTSHGQP